MLARDSTGFHNYLVFLEYTRFFALQVIIGSLQVFHWAQTLSILLVNSAYFGYFVKMISTHKVFQSKMFMVKSLIQELCILVTILAFTIFSFAEDSKFSSSPVYSLIEILVIISIGLTAGSELAVLASSMALDLLKPFKRKLKKIENSQKSKNRRNRGKTRETTPNESMQVLNDSQDHDNRGPMMKKSHRRYRNPNPFNGKKNKRKRSEEDRLKSKRNRTKIPEDHMFEKEQKRHRRHRSENKNRYFGQNRPEKASHNRRKQKEADQRKPSINTTTRDKMRNNHTKEPREEEMQNRGRRRHQRQRKNDQNWMGDGWRRSRNRSKGDRKEQKDEKDCKKQAKRPTKKKSRQAGDKTHRNRSKRRPQSPVIIDCNLERKKRRNKRFRSPKRRCDRMISRDRPLRSQVAFVAQNGLGEGQGPSSAMRRVGFLPKRR